MKLAQYRQSLAYPARPLNVPTPPASAATSARPTTSAADMEKYDLPEIQPLVLPSELEGHELDNCASGLADMEARLRDAQLCDALDKLRVHLHIRSRLVQFKNRHVRHQ